MNVGRGLAATALLATLLLAVAPTALGSACHTGGESVQTTEARVTKLARAMARYVSHMGAAPPSLQALTRPATNATGVAGGPFIDMIGPPLGWEPYIYVADSDRGYRISTSGRVATVEAVGLGADFEIRVDLFCVGP